MHDIHCSAVPEGCSARTKRAAWLFGRPRPGVLLWRRPRLRYPVWRRITRPVRFVSSWVSPGGLADLLAER